MKKYLLLSLIFAAINLNAQSCPTGNVTWLNSGLLIIDFASDTEASAVFDVSTTISVDGCTNATGTLYSCPDNLTDTQPIENFEIAGGSNQRIRPSGPTLWRNDGAGSFTGELVFTLMSGQTLTCTFLGGSLTSGVLPVELASFEATTIGKDVKLIWSTVQEINSEYTVVERRSSNNNWEELSRVKAQGNSSKTQNYQYTDHSASAGNQYYRLKMVDQDGYFEYSDVRQVSIERKNSNIAVYPSTVSRGASLTADLSHIENQKVTIIAYNMNGTYNNLGVYDTENIVNLDLSELMPGLKVIKISGEGFSETHKIMVAK